MTSRLRRFLLIGGLVLAAIIAVLLQGASRTGLLWQGLTLPGETPALLPSPSPGDLPGQDQLPLPTPRASVPYSTRTSSGELLPQYGPDGTTLTGWVYQDQDLYRTCTAGPDGIWTSCTYSPKDAPWPPPVPEDLKENPPTPAPTLPQ